MVAASELAGWTDAQQTQFDEQHHGLVGVAGSNARIVYGFGIPVAILKETGDVETIHVPPQNVRIHPQNRGGQMLSGQVMPLIIASNAY